MKPIDWDGLRTLTIARDRNQDGDNPHHACLTVRPRVHALLSYSRGTETELYAGVHANWPRIVGVGAEVAGVLGRLGLAVTYDVQVNAATHGCDSTPRLRQREPDSSELGSHAIMDGCHVYLLPDPGRPGDELLTEGQMPTLDVWIPRNRERAWTQRLTSTLRAIADSDAKLVDVFAA